MSVNEITDSLCLSALSVLSEHRRNNVVYYRDDNHIQPLALSPICNVKCVIWGKRFQPLCLSFPDYEREMCHRI